MISLELHIMERHYKHAVYVHIVCHLMSPKNNEFTTPSHIMEIDM